MCTAAAAAAACTATRGRGCRGGGDGAVRARTTPVKNILYTPRPAAAYNAYTHRKDDDDNNNDILYP